MRLIKLTANKNTFKDVVFNDGFNLIVANRGDKSTNKDSRNGLGKSTLLHLINFCLCGSPSDTLKKNEMQDWTFKLDVELQGSTYTFSRSVENDKKIEIMGDLDKLGISADEGINVISVDTLKPLLAKAIFNLNPNSTKDLKNSPSYRSLISYFLRTDSTAFNNPFAYFSQQKTWSRQVNNAYLLGLDWESVSSLHEMKSKLERLEDVNKAIKNGDLSDFGSSLGELESEKITRTTKLRKTTEKLKSFKVHEQYHDMQQKADTLTKTIHKTLNRLNINKQVVEKYNNDLSNESTSEVDIESLYEEAKVTFGDSVKRTLQEVREFHSTSTKNRQDYLKTEIKKLEREIKNDEESVKELVKEKAGFMKLLESHGALEEYSILQDDVNAQQSEVDEIESQIARIKDVEEQISTLRVEIEELTQSMRRDNKEKQVNLEAAINIFNDNSEYLYEQPGVLSVDISKNGYTFKVDMKRSSSDGVNSMKVFCYDLMLAEYWKTIRKRDVPLFHDSRVFDGVDGRQVAKALQLAKAKSDRYKIQYICSINSDAIPTSDFDEGFEDELMDSVMMNLSDEDDSGTLTGIRF